MKRYLCLVLALGWLAVPASAVQAGPDSDLQTKVRQYRQAHEHAIITECVELLSIPNVSSDHVDSGAFLVADSSPGAGTF